jgi:ABC-2 type transport system permease protein
MSRTGAIYVRELRYFFHSITAYAVIALFLAISGYFFFNTFRWYNLLSLQAVQAGTNPGNLNLIDGVMRDVLANISVLIVFLLPFLTMRLVAEEKKQGTFELVSTYPVSDISIVAGKFLASVTVYLVMLACTLLYPGMLVYFAEPEIAPMLTGYLGLILMGSVFIAMGTFFSSLTDHQIIAGVFTLVACLFLLLIGGASYLVGPAFAEILTQISILYHFESFSKGVFDSSDATYYLFLTLFFLFLTVRSLETTRWKS